MILKMLGKFSWLTTTCIRNADRRNRGLQRTCASYLTWDSLLTWSGLFIDLLCAVVLWKADNRQQVCVRSLKQSVDCQLVHHLSTLFYEKWAVKQFYTGLQLFFLVLTLFLALCLSLSRSLALFSISLRATNSCSV